MSYGHPHDLDAIIEVFIFDVYGIRRIPRSAVVFDLGSGIGDFAIAVANRIGPKGTVFAIEPNPKDFQLLSQNLTANKLANDVAENVALSSSHNPLSLSFKDSSFTAYTRSLKTILERAGLSIQEVSRRPIVLKLDIEGAEAQTLIDLERILSSVLRVAIEMHGTKERIDEFLIPKGFTFTRLTRRSYLSKLLLFFLRHPLSSIVILRHFREVSGSLGLKRLLSGIEITSSTDLVVGVYLKQRPPSATDAQFQ